MRGLGAVACCLFVSCYVPGTADPPPQSPTLVPVVVQEEVPTGEAAAPVTVAPASDCGATLTVTEMRRSSSSCYVDEVVTRTPGTLRYPCVGGDAVVTFGPTARFAGWARDGTIDVKIQTEFPFSDGCRWRSVQLIQGTLSTGQLVFQYRESPVEGQRGCASACSADAVVRVVP
jgi:hypothetical protein